MSKSSDPCEFIVRDNEGEAIGTYTVEVTKKPATVKNTIQWYVEKHKVNLPKKIDDLSIDSLKILALQAVSEKYDEVLEHATVKTSRGIVRCTESDINYVRLMIEAVTEHSIRSYTPVIQLTNGNFCDGWNENNELTMAELKFIKGEMLDRYLKLKANKIYQISNIKKQTDKKCLLNDEMFYETTLDN